MLHYTRLGKGHKKILFIHGNLASTHWWGPAMDRLADEFDMLAVDLPGYGYAKVPQAEKERWSRLMEEYFQAPERVTLGVMIVDSRHKPTADDVTMCSWFKSTGRALVIVANKCDKLKNSEIEPNMDIIRCTLGLDDAVPLLPFSAEKGTGRDKLLTEIARMI